MKMRFVSTVALCLIQFLSCNKEAPTSPKLAVDPNPSVSIVTPTDNSSFVDTTTIEISASDDKGITKVELFIDNQIVKTFILPPYRYFWVVDTLSDSTYHSVYARAYDSDNNMTGSQVKTIFVRKERPYNLLVNSLTIGGLEISWTSNGSLASGFVVQASVNNQDYFDIGTFSSKTRSAKISKTFVINTSYSFRVGAMISGVYKYSQPLSQTCALNMFHKAYGTYQAEMAASILQTQDTGYVIVGHTTPSDYNDPSIYIVATDAGGTMKWEKTIGTHEAAAISTILSNDGSIIVGGTMRERHIW